MLTEADYSVWRIVPTLSALKIDEYTGLANFVILCTRRRDFSTGHFDLMHNHKYLFYTGYRLYLNEHTLGPSNFADSTLLVAEVLTGAVTLVSGALATLAILI